MICSGAAGWGLLTALGRCHDEEALCNEAGVVWPHAHAWLHFSCHDLFWMTLSQVKSCQLYLRQAPPGQVGTAQVKPDVMVQADLVPFHCETF